MTTFATINNGFVTNLIELDNLENWHGEEEVVPVVSLIQGRHVAIGWNYQDKNFIPPLAHPLPENRTGLDKNFNEAMWQSIAQEQQIAAYLVKLGILKSNPSQIEVTKL